MLVLPRWHQTEGRGDLRLAHSEVEICLVVEGRMEGKHVRGLRHL